VDNYLTATEIKQKYRLSIAGLLHWERQRNNLIGEQAKKIAALAKKSNRVLVVENLKFRDDKSVKSKFNRISHGFVWSKFLAMVERASAREGVPLIKVKPPYTSVIGILKYQQQYGLSNHEAAAYVIGRRGLGFETEQIPKPLQKFVYGKKQPEFESLNNWQQWSSIKKSILKRKEVKDLSFWQHTRKQIV